MENYEAAKELGDARRYRSCASRAYYAAFSAVTHAVSGHAPLTRGRETPAHAKLPQLVKDHSGLDKQWARRVMAAIRRLYDFRIAADYQSSRTVDEGVARRARRDARLVCSALGVLHETSH